MKTRAFVLAVAISGLFAGCATHAPGCYQQHNEMVPTTGKPMTVYLWDPTSSDDVYKACNFRYYSWAMACVLRSDVPFHAEIIASRKSRYPLDGLADYFVVVSNKTEAEAKAIPDRNFGSLWLHEVEYHGKRAMVHPVICH